MTSREEKQQKHRSAVRAKQTNRDSTTTTTTHHLQHQHQHQHHQQEQEQEQEQHTTTTTTTNTPQHHPPLPKPAPRLTTRTDRHDDSEDHSPERSDGVEDQKLTDGRAHPESYEVEVDLRVVGHEPEERHELILVHQRHEREDSAECRHDEHHLNRAQVLP